VHTGENLPEVAGGSDKHANTLPGHCHHAYRVLRVRLHHPTTRSNQIRNPRNPSSQETAKVRSIGSVDGAGGYLGLGAADEVDGIGLRLEPRRSVVAVPHPFRIVYADHRCLQRKTNTMGD
jgi:hypothetical protein